MFYEINSKRIKNRLVIIQCKNINCNPTILVSTYVTRTYVHMYDCTYVLYLIHVINPVNKMKDTITKQ